jgi:hypothetical protein
MILLPSSQTSLGKLRRSTLCADILEEVELGDRGRRRFEMNVVGVGIGSGGRGSVSGGRGELPETLMFAAGAVCALGKSANMSL